MFRFTYLVFHILCFAAVYTDKLKFYQEKKYHQLKEMDIMGIRKLNALSDVHHFTQVLDRILVPRVVGTKAHKEVGDYIIEQMEHLDWTVEINNFKDNTPVFGHLEFRNIIARLNPNAERYLVLACHYDSKYTREHVFVGATDSAVPCAMMINIAKTLGPYLEQFINSPLSLMFIFFDGEEAFRQWGPNDSIYGARHLAAKWERTPFKDGTNHLQRIDVLILLDLIGTPDPVFYSYFPSTEKWYVRLATIEQELAENNMLENYSKGKAEQTYFRLRSSGSFVEDDHIPFLRRGVDILHIIPTPFPPEWHTKHDNRAALDFKTIENLLKIFRMFVAEYMHVTP